MRLSRLVTAGLAMLALVLSLSAGSLLHVHTGSGYLSDHTDSRGILVHSHLPVPSNGPEPAGASVDDPSHDGEGIDLFLSVAGEQAPMAVGVKSNTGVIPQPSESRQLGAPGLDRTHDPPLRSRSPRAPPA